ncbi:MAG: ABC transporter ATP-binding protein [Chlorogloeopsis fritschii C42_A2020_084]|uniref:ABC transporter ATP-binding protein n=1 Tax=Chlorogloeopsis fritschii TaxID=1124 RepID=UPI0019F35B2E|nr:ABC transporter ATP-binding protein [Chlorogloeopsis fritschii]MBF2008939.1 ABC transporter ATP-binding protein [Chlorogloeopsis fritschii C42_A2020_084]
MIQIPRAISGNRIWLLTRLVINGFCQAAAAVANAILVEMAFDKLITTANAGFDHKMVWQIGLGLVAAAIVNALLRVMERADAERIGQDYAYEIRMILYERLMSLAPRALQNRSQGGVMLRFVGDLTALRQWVSLGLARLTVALTTTIASLAALSLVSSRLAFTVGLVLAIGALSSIKLGGRMQSVAKEARRRLSNLAANINEKVASIAVVQVFGQSQREKKRIARQSRRLEEAMVDRAMVAGQLRGITEGTAAIASGAALVVGALEVAAGRTTPGVVVAAMTIVGFLVPPLRDLGRVQEYWHNSRVALQKVEQFLKTPSLVTEQRNAPELQLGAGRLEFDSVSLKGSLHEVSAIAEPGKIVALVGPNGAGKSTLLSLAARLIDPDKGKILLDGQDLAKYSLESVRRAIGMAGPDLPLLRGTVEKNLRYRWRDASVEEITRVRQICGIDEVLAELAEGEKTKVAEGGKGLSAGQRQRIGLARAILGNPPVLLLDEVDANLDAQATTVVDRVLAEHKGTVLIITHRKERLAAADVIWYLENGRLVEKGPPEVLLNSDGPTARLFRDSQEKVLSA